ncbi:hypothetical protein M9458_027396, partial [Cirrhinus mrigala]
ILCRKWRRSTRKLWCPTPSWTTKRQTSSTKWTHSKTSSRRWKSKCQSCAEKQKTDQ